MSGVRGILIGATCLLSLAWLVGCTRAPERSPKAPAGTAGTTVGEDLRGVAKATEKTAKDIGHATVDLADKGGQGLEDATSKAGVRGQDAWLTTKVKSELTTAGFDPLHVHVDTDGKVVTLSGSVQSSAEAQRAAGVARAVTGVAGVKDHLFINPSQR